MHQSNSAGKQALRWVGVAAAVIVTGAGLRIYMSAAKGQTPQQSGKNAGDERTQVSVQTATLVATPHYLEVTGTIRPEFESAISSKVVGRVDRVLVKEGDTITKGQAVIQLDAGDLNASVAQSQASVETARSGYDGARIAAGMERSLSVARITQAKAAIARTDAALQAAMARLQLVQAGPRRQDREQAAIAVSQARSNLTLAESNKNRMAALYKDGAISAQQNEQVSTQFAVARSQYQNAVQARSAADEGSRPEEIKEAQQAVQQAKSALEEANAGLKTAEASAMLADLRQQDVTTTRAQVVQAKSGLTLAKVNRAYAVISSPFAGIVSKRLADPGVMAAPGAALLTVQGGAMRMEAVVPESAIAAVTMGQPVTVLVNSQRQRTMIGRVVEISPQGDANSHTFIVKLMLPQGSAVSEGMFAVARLSTSTDKSILLPAEAVFEREGLHYLFVVDANHVAKLRMVTVGAVEAGKLPILSGLSTGERVVTGGASALNDGMSVSEGSM